MDFNGMRGMEKHIVVRKGRLYLFSYRHNIRESTLGVSCVKMGKLGLIVIGLLLIAASIYIYTQNVAKDDVPIDHFSKLTQEKREIAVKEVGDFQATLTKEDGFYAQVSEKLKEKGYEHNMLIVGYAIDDIWVKLILTNKEANKAHIKEVKKIFNNVIIKNKMDPIIFKVKVSNEESTDW